MPNRVVAEFARLLGVSLVVTEYQGKAAFSYMLLGLYDFFLCRANDRQFLLMCLKEKTEFTPGSVARHMAHVQAISGLLAVFANDSMLPYKRKRFIEKNIPFIIPGKQAYLPFAGVFLTEGGPKLAKSFDELGNLAQILVLARLQKKISMPLSIAEAVEAFSYSRISVIRAFDELEYFALAQRNPQSKHLEFTLTGKELWRKALPYLKNPCKKQLGQESVPRDLLSFPAGITALSERSMLASDTQLHVAVEAKEFNKLNVTDLCPEEDAPVVVELWRYPPNSIEKESVDACSLYLTMQGNSDDRVQMALDDMMKEVLQ